MAKWRRSFRAIREFLKKEALSAAFKGSLPWVIGGATSLAYTGWEFLRGPSGPLVIPIAVAVFAGVVLIVVVGKTLRDETLTKERMRVISETAAIPAEESGILDFGAGIEQAIVEVVAATNQVASETQRYGRLAKRQGRKFATHVEKSFVEKRHLAIRAARAFDRRSDVIERRVERLEKAGSTLDENFVGFVKLSTDPGVLRTIRQEAKTIMTAAPGAINGTKSFHRAVVDLHGQRIQRDLSQSMVRLRDLLHRIIVVFESTQKTSETVVRIANQKLKKQGQLKQ